MAIPKTKNIDIEISKNLQKLFMQLEIEVQKVAGERMAMSLVIFNSEPGARLNYISNVDRSAVIEVYETLIAGWKDGMPDVPAHKVC